MGMCGGNGAGILPEHAALALEAERSRSAAASPVSFEAVLHKAISSTALNSMLTDRVRSSVFARRLYAEELAGVHDVLLNVPVQVRVAQQKALATVYNTTATALMLSGLQSEGAHLLFMFRALSPCS